MTDSIIRSFFQHQWYLLKKFLLTKVQYMLGSNKIQISQANNTI